MGRLQHLTIAAAAAIGLALTASQPAHAANLTMCDSPACGAAWGTIVFNVDGFEAGFSVNGTQIQIGRNNPVSVPFSKHGPFEPFDMAAQIFFSGTWVMTRNSPPVTPQNQTIFFIKPNPLRTIISTVLQYTYTQPQLSGNVDGFVLSFFEDGYDPGILGPLPFQPTATIPETANFYFSNTAITANLQSDVSLAAVPEPASLARELEKNLPTD